MPPNMPPETAVTPSFWIFAYGSLIWNPGFAYLSKRQATLYGYHRSFCIYSHIYRGTPEHPGLVLGLDRGGACRGLAYEVSCQHHDKVMTYLRAREQVTTVYIEAGVMLHLNGGEHQRATTYIADRSHRQYAGRLPREHQLELIRQGQGKSGSNIEYLENTQKHLQQMKIRDHTLEWLVGQL